MSEQANIREPGVAAPFARSVRFDQLERPGLDFPFYNGLPVAITLQHWCLLLALSAGGFLLLVAPIPYFEGTWASFIPVLLFCALPLLGFWIAVEGHWRAVFRPVEGRDFLLMAGIAVLNIAVTLPVAIIVGAVTGINPNQATAGIENLHGLGQVLFFARTLVQLLGEELITIIPFLAVMTLLTQGGQRSRRQALVWAWCISALLFGLAHLPTYGWNVIQCVVVIGTSRLILTLAYIRTKNIWVCTGAHVVSDWILFALTILLSRLH